MTEFGIREATSSDIDGIHRTTESAWQAAYGDILSQDVIDIAMTDGFERAAVKDAIETDETAYYIAQTSGKIVGYITGLPSDDPRVAILSAIYVLPKQWGEGIGTRLLETFETYCRRRDIEEIRVKAFSGNSVGLSFYRNHGFEHVGRRETELFGENVSESILSYRIG